MIPIVYTSTLGVSDSDNSFFQEATFLIRLVKHRKYGLTVK